MSLWANGSHSECCDAAVHAEVTRKISGAEVVALAVVDGGDHYAFCYEQFCPDCAAGLNTHLAAGDAARSPPRQQHHQLKAHQRETEQ